MNIYILEKLVPPFEKQKNYFRFLYAELVKVKDFMGISMKFLGKV